MRVYKTLEPTSETYDFNSLLILMNSNNGFFKSMIEENMPIINGLSDISLYTFKNKYNLFFLDNIKTTFNINHYLNLINQFCKYNICNNLSLQSEVYSTFLAILSEDFIKQIFDRNKELELIDIFSYDDFINDLYEKLLIVKNDRKFISTIKSILEKNEYFKILSSIKLFSDDSQNVKYNLKLFFEGLCEGIDNLRKHDSSSELEFTANFDDLTFNEKVDWFKKYDPNINLFVVDVANMGMKIFEGINHNTLFNPEFDTLNRLSNKYKSFVDSINMNEQNCALYKTLIYTTLYLCRDKINISPAKYMKKLIDRDSRWATDDEKTVNPSFYGNSDIWKMFYGYGPFMSGQKNPFKEIIDNKQVDDMDRQALLMHKWFKNNGLSGIVYNILYEKGVAGDYSIYDLISMSKDLLALLEEPIVASSAIDSLTGTIKGIVSGIINSFVTTIDFKISGIARSLFYKKFIPINQNKISISEFHDYVAFVSAILKCYDKGSPVGIINKDNFIDNVYRKLSGGVSGFEEIGYGAFSSELNINSGLGQYFDYLTKDNKGKIFYMEQQLKTLYTLIMFSIQKQFSKFGAGFKNIINYGSRIRVKELISTLTESEIFFVLHHFKIDFSRFNTKFTKYNMEEIVDFNNSLIDANLYLSLDPSGNFYRKYESYDKNILALEMKQTYFRTCEYRKYIRKSLDIYFEVVDLNKNSLAKAIFNTNKVSNVDDFLMRFLPSFEELSKTLGFSKNTISELIYILDYICEFITSILFKRLYLDIKNLINNYVKSITEDLFTIVDGVGEKLGGNNTTIIKFEFGGKFISGKLDSLLKILDDFTLTTEFLDQCFLNPDIENVYIDKFIDNNLNFVGDMNNYYDENIKVDIVDKTNQKDTTGIDIEDGDYIENKKEPIEITIVDKKEEKKETFIEKIIETPFEKKDPPKIIIYDKGKVEVITENGRKVTIIDKNDKIENGNLIVTDETNKRIESEIISKNEIEQFIEIRDFVSNITNEVILDLQNKINSVKKEIQAELNKNKPDNSKLKELISQETELNEKLTEVKKNTGTVMSEVDKTKLELSDDKQVIIHDFSNGDVNFDKLESILKDLNDFSVNNKIPLTTAQIMQLLR